MNQWRALPYVFLVLATSPALAQDDDDTPNLDEIPHITMTGTARTEVAPDLAVVTVGVATEKPGAKAAADDNAKTATAVVNAAKAAGVAPADIATQSVTLTQLYDDIQDPNGRYIGRKPKGFEAVNTITIRVRDLTKAGPLAQTLIEKGANRFDGISFTVERPEPILAKLTGEAVTNARELASVAARAAGVKLGRVLQIARSGSSGSPPVFAAARAKLTAAPAAVMPVEAGSSELSAVMEVTWAIAPN